MSKEIQKNKQRFGEPTETLNVTKCRGYKLIGLNRRSKSGIYATVQYNGEDWFHSNFDEISFPIDRQYALFDLFNNGDDNIWKGNNRVTVQADNFKEDGGPVNPIIKVVYLDI